MKYCKELAMGLGHVILTVNRGVAVMRRDGMRGKAPSVSRFQRGRGQWCAASSVTCQCVIIYIKIKNMRKKMML